MPALSPDELLATTRSVRRRLDTSRPVERELIEECLRLAQQAPSGGNRQGAVFVVVTEPERRRALGELYRRGWQRYLEEGILGDPPRRPADPAKRGQGARLGRSACHSWSGSYTQSTTGSFSPFRGSFGASSTPMIGEPML